jgi:ATP-dependent DNA ligase
VVSLTSRHSSVAFVLPGISGEAPAYLVVFDILALGRDDLRALPNAQRRELVAGLLAEAASPLALMPMTTHHAGAQALLTDHTATGIEGVVVKHLKHAYRPGLRSWRKVRTRVTAEAVVGGVIGPLKGTGRAHPGQGG